VGSEVDVGGLRVAYTVVGSGPPLVLLHGGLADRRDWTGQLGALSEEFTLYAWDAPGCGGSADPPESWRMPDYADCVAGWLAAIGLPRAHLLGLSWGSTLALEVYHRHPDLVASLIVVGAYAGWAGSLSAEQTQRRLDASIADLALPPEAWAASYLPTMVSSEASPETVADLIAAMSEQRPSGARPMLHAMAEADLRPVLPTIRVPTLLVYGEHDVRAPRDVAHDMQRSIPGSQLVHLPRAGHCCNAERPAEFNEQVRLFLSELSL
jgi:pimeloyl-ACP methyl ester carboxylesterase